MITERLRGIYQAVDSAFVAIPVGRSASGFQRSKIPGAFEDGELVYDYTVSAEGYRSNIKERLLTLISDCGQDMRALEEALN